MTRHNLPSAPDIQAPPAAPRPIGPEARRRSWNEPSVRFWWISALGMLGIAGYLAGTQYLTWATEADLIRNGTKVQAKVTQAAGQTVVGRRVPPDSPVRLEFKLNGADYEFNGFLFGREEFIIVDDLVDIRVDPKNPRSWTYRTEPVPLLGHLLGAILVTPLSILLAVVAVIMRIIVLRRWRSGEALQAVVVDRKQTAVAPLSYAVRCNPVDRRDRRLLTVHIPRSAADPQPGDTIWLILGEAGSGRPLAAMLFSP